MEGGIPMRLIKRLSAGLLSAVLLLGLCSGWALAAGSSGAFTLGIYFTADLYGKWYSVDPNTDKTVTGNYLKVVSAMADWEKNHDAKLLIDAGNSTQGPSTTYRMNMARGESAPVALSLRYADYDAFFPGSCERELRAECRKELYNNLTDPAGTLSGTSVAVLQADSGSGREDRTAPFLVRSYPVNGGEFRVALVSLEQAESWQTFRETQSCDLVVAVVPSGLLEGPMADLVSGVSGVDLILVNDDGVSGTIDLRDAQGARVPVVRGGGDVLTRTEVTVNKQGTFSIGKSEGLELSNRRNDDNLGALLAPYYESAKVFGSQKLGILSGGWDWETELSLVQSDTMNFIHEAQLWASNADISIALPPKDPHFSMSSLLDGQRAVSLDRKSCCAIYPDENDRLLMVRMTGTQLRSWLEDSAGRYTVEEDDAISVGPDASQVYGVSYTMCLGNPVGERIINMTYQGEPITTAQTFRVAVSESCLTAAGADLQTYPLLWEAAADNFQTLGGSVTWILGEYIQSLSATGNKQITPPKARSRWRVTTASQKEAMAPVTRLEFVEALNASLGSPKAKTRCAFFSDVRKTSLDLIFPSVLDWAVEQGIVQGNGGGLFNPNAPISREQAAIMLLRFDLARNMGPSGSWAVGVPYTDATEISAWASEAIMWNVIRGYLSDDEQGYFRPQDPLTSMELDGILEKLGK